MESIVAEITRRVKIFIEALDKSPELYDTVVFNVITMPSESANIIMETASSQINDYVGNLIERYTIFYKQENLDLVLYCRKIIVSEQETIGYYYLPV
jgi:trehalose-6-phosphate synthase